MPTVRTGSCLISSCLVLSLAVGCSNQHKEPEGPAAAVQTHTYQAVGTLKAIDPKLPVAEIDHEDIPGLMPAMQMQFHVKDRSLLAGLAVGDRIKFTVENGVGGMKITAIQKL
jgi:protein SCO1